MDKIKIEPTLDIIDIKQELSDDISNEYEINNHQFGIEFIDQQIEQEFIGHTPEHILSDCKTSYNFIFNKRGHKLNKKSSHSDIKSFIYQETSCGNGYSKSLDIINIKQEYFKKTLNDYEGNHIFQKHSPEKISPASIKTSYIYPNYGHKSNTNFCNSDVSFIYQEKSHDDAFSDEKLINSIFKRVPIWNKFNPEYKNIQLKAQLWHEILTELNLGIVHLKKIKKRWDILKTCYSRANKPRLNDTATMFRKQFKYAQLMSFLDTKIKLKETRTIDCLEDSNSNVIITPLRIQKRSLSEHRTDNSKIKKQCLEKFQNTMYENHNSANEHFAKLLFDILNKLPEKQQRKTWSEILRVANRNLSNYQAINSTNK